MVNKKIVIVVYVLVMLAVLPYIQAKISLGSVQDGKSAEIAQGDTAVFRILFFNIHEKPSLFLRMNADYPEGWNVVVVPDSLRLEYTEPGNISKETGYEYLSTPAGIVKAKVVYVKVKVPEFAEDGEYMVRVSTKTGKEGETLSTFQVRNFYFRIDVKNKDENIVSDVSENSGEKKPEKYRKDTDSESPNKKDDDAPVNKTNHKHKEEKENNNGVKNFLDETSGMIINNPNVSVFVLISVLVVVVFLRATKKI